MGGGARPLRILAVATYYRPYLSGLTVYLQRVAEALAQEGHQVVVLTSRFPQGAAGDEVLNGVRVVRVPVGLSVSKGVVTPGLLPALLRLGRDADVVWLVLPQPGAGVRSWVVKNCLEKPLVVSYLCDVTLGGGLASRAAQTWLALSHRSCLRKADAVVALSSDYAASSPLLARLSRRTHVIPPPVPRLVPDPEIVASLRRRWGLLPGQPVVGFVGRVSREKGIHVLAQAMPQVWADYPEARVVCVGPHEEVAGERAYLREIERAVRPFGGRWLLAGVLPDRELAAFYACCTVLAFPSVNRTEAFGMVQVEAMTVGTPVVASDLPGVREPVRLTGMGLLVPAGDPKALAAALLRVLAGDLRPEPHRLSVFELFSPATVANAFLQIFTELSQNPLGSGEGVALQ